jgi:hypothetical protein
METIRIKYTGSMSKVKSNWTRKTFVFSKDNGFTLDVPEPLARELLMLGKYKVVPLTISEQVHNVGIVEPIEEVEEEVKPVKKHVGRPKKGAK